MTQVATLQRRTTSTFIAAVLAAAAVFVPLSATRAALHDRVVPASLAPRAALPAAGYAHIDPALSGLRGVVRVIIQTTDARAAEAAVARAGGKMTLALPIAHAIAATIPSSAIPTLAKIASVRTISLDAKVHMLGQPDPSKVRSVYQKSVNADRVWSSGYTGSGVTVALVDTGIAPVADLAGRVKTVTTDALGQTAPCMNFSGEPNCDDSYGHGTFIAGLIGSSGASSSGAYTGIAPNVRFVSVKIAGRDGSADVSKVLAAIQWVVSYKDTYGIKVLNLSLGTDSAQTYRTDPFDYAVEQAWQAGIAVVVSAGNLGPNPQTISKPADDPFVITVGAVDDKGTQGLGDDELPNFSSRGPTAADGLTKPDVVAPGAHLPSLRAPGSAVDTNFPTYDATYPSYRRGSGTSMAAGVVSGSVALLVQAHPTWSPDRIKFALMSTAHNVASTDPNDVGSGEIDVLGALNAPAGLANQGVTPGNGTGSLDLSRGSVQTQLDDPYGTVLSGMQTAQLLTFSTVLYTTTPWTSMTWPVSQFAGSGWYGSGWYGSGWYGSGWYGSGWYGQPGGSGWYGSGWYGSGWYGVWDTN